MGWSRERKKEKKKNSKNNSMEGVNRSNKNRTSGNRNGNGGQEEWRTARNAMRWSDMAGHDTT